MKIKIERGHNCDNTNDIFIKESNMLKKFDFQKNYENFQKRIEREKRADAAIGFILLFMTISIFSMYLFIASIYH